MRFAGIKWRLDCTADIKTCLVNPAQADLEIEEQTGLRYFQGPRQHLLEGLDVIKPVIMISVPHDG